MGKPKICITIDESLLGRLKELAVSQRLPLSTLIERLLREAVAEEELLLHPAVRESLAQALASKNVLGNLTKMLGDALSPGQKETVRGKLRQLGKSARQS